MTEDGLIGRNRPPRGWEKAMALSFIAIFVGYVVWSMFGWAMNIGSMTLTVIFGVIVTIMTLNMLSAIWWRSWAHLPVPDMRVVAIIPVYEEKTERVHEVVWSLINQTVPPEHIYVVDDGSEIPLQGFSHPRVTWIRQENAGKRFAQLRALEEFKREDYDLILTVDSDSIFDRDAVEHLMRPFHNEKIMAATGMIYTANRKQNFMTRMTDINLQVACTQIRMMRSWLGILSPTSGATAMYRPWVIWDNIEDYKVSGYIGDDRRLSFYALLKGQVVCVNESGCETYLPSTPKGVWAQRTRWTRSAWLGVPFILTNFSWWMIFWYMYPLIFQIIFPVTFVWLSYLWIAHDVPTIWYGIFFWFITSVCTAGVAYPHRPAPMTWREKWYMIGLSTVYPIWANIFLRISGYKALLTINDQGWGTRGAGAPEPEIIHSTADVVIEQPELADVIGMRRSEVA